MKGRQENRKEILVKEALAKFPLTAALYFRDKKGGGLLLGSKSNRNGFPWFDINVPKSLINPSVGEEEDSKNKFPAGIVVGIGPRSELTSVVDIYRDIITDELSHVGVYEDFPKYVIECLAEEINKVYRATNPSIPYRIELLVMSYINNVVNLTRIKADGDFHELGGYGVIGGYQKLESGKTIRGRAIELLDGAYANGFPNEKQAEKIMKSLMGIDKTHYRKNFSAAVTFY